MSTPSRRLASLSQPLPAQDSGAVLWSEEPKSGIISTSDAELDSFRSLSPSAFWDLADDEKLQTQYRADAKLQYLQRAPLEVLQKIFIQYRYFTIYYISDLAQLVVRLPFGKMRSIMAEFLNDELGNGDEEAAHTHLYDQFLTSIGIPANALDLNPNAKNLQVLGEISDEVRDTALWNAVGLRGMGGECLCQVYLSAMHYNFMKNPAIQELSGAIAWKFWDIHTGEVDIHHRELLRKVITEQIERQPELTTDLARGYFKAKAAFEALWDNAFREAR
jgi:hypothetical protein